MVFWEIHNLLNSNYLSNNWRSTCKKISRQHLFDLLGYTNGLVLFTNTPAQAKCLLSGLEQAPRDIDPYEISDKTVNVF